MSVHRVPMISNTISKEKQNEALSSFVWVLYGYFKNVMAENVIFTNK